MGQFFVCLFLHETMSQVLLLNTHPFILSSHLLVWPYCCSPLPPQLLLMVALSLRFARSDLPFCLFAQTLTFVAFNKVTDRG